MNALLAAISYDPIVHIEIGPLKISPHGIGIAVGFLLGARLMLPEAKRQGISEESVYTVLIRAAIGAMVGARVAYVVNHIGDYADAPLDILRVWEGGISLLGGIFGAIILALPVMRKLGLDVWKTLDAAAPGIALGIIVGRIGDLVVGDHLGTRTDFFLGYRCTTAETASPCEAPVGQLVHQTALYDLILTCGLLALLLTLRKRWRDSPSGYDGQLILVFGAWYGVGRLIEDFLREDVRRLGLTGSQWTALATVLVSLTWLVVVKRSPRCGHWSKAPRTATGDAEPTISPATPSPTSEETDPSWKSASE
ncbi:MAG TPA: prolipoprotein diacylglyceryl transferase [Acidimicrobiales bacterium]|nr:prolipoprotein diacylglyceryl transferase [Acidimicrobiales bacterium]